MLLRLHTAGESHGPLVAALLEGVPAGLALDAERVNRDLVRRQSGYGRGGRMAIESDRVEFLAGVRWGRTTGAPLLLGVGNRDAENWQQGLSATSEARGSIPAVTEVRPGHADLPGVLKYDLRDARDVLERASARETAARVAAGGVAKALLEAFDIRVGSFVTGIGEVRMQWAGDLAGLHTRAEEGRLRLPDPETDHRAVELIDACRERGDTLGGTFVCFAKGVPVGLGGHAVAVDRLDGRLGQAFLSVPAIKGISVGIGFGAAELPGSQVHDEILPGEPGDGRRGGVRRATNRAGGIEGGISNGEDLWVEAAMKPIPTLMSPLRTVDLATGKPVSASKERSDVCAVPAASVVGEAVLALELARAVTEKFGGDCLTDMKEAFDAYLDRINAQWPFAG